MMKLSEGLIWALECYTLSGIKFLCDDEVKEPASEYFRELMCEKWDEAIEAAKEEYDDVEEDDCPVEVYTTDYGFYVEIESLDVKYDYGSFYDLDLGRDALDQTLAAFSEKYPGIVYEGYIGFPVSDEHGGEDVQWEVWSEGNEPEEDKLYDFVGEKLNGVLTSEKNDGNSDFWNALESDDDFCKTVDSLYTYRKWIDDDVLLQGFDTILELSDDDEDVEELINIYKEKMEDL